MKAVFIEQHGDASVLRYGDFAKPEPAAGQVLVKLAAAGVNFIDTYQRSGLYKIPLPAVLGMEGAGTVEALGEGVSWIATRRSRRLGHVARQLRRIRGGAGALSGEGSGWPRPAPGRGRHAARHDRALPHAFDISHRTRPHRAGARRRRRHRTPDLADDQAARRTRDRHRRHSRKSRSRARGRRRAM